ncbi:MAG: T9SS type A sorting domain-containing protein [Rubricoccaceae bacterium]|nr:T9SS type A sorting domain-containing protein [Rubricoccaceae bacterium]
MRTYTLLIAAALMLVLVPCEAVAQSVGGLNYSATANCGSVPTGHVEWPVSDPLWTFDFIRPQESSGGRGSGLEIRDVYYDGHLVFRAAHVPILNVEYEPGVGCGCYRDWQYEPAGYATDGIRAGSESCVADATAGAVITTCDTNEAGGTGGDPGSFTGIAIEEFDSELVLTANLRAGWYRYRVKWHFYLDGRVWPEFSFSAEDDVCTNATHRHHAYWRFDFDVDGSGGDVVREVNPGMGTSTTYTTETVSDWGDPADGVFWTITDESSGLGYDLVPSSADLLLPIDDFSKLDVAVAQYRPTELDDGADSLGECEIELENGYNGTTPIINGESLVDEDIVLWYRSGANHLGGNPWECDIVGPMLTRVLPTAGEEGPAPEEMPDGFLLESAYPNPFNPSTTVRFKVADEQSVTVSLFDALGRKVATLFSGFVESNRFETVRIDGSRLPSGTYTVRLEGENILGSTRVVLIK